MDPNELVKAIANNGVGVVAIAVLIFLHIYNVRITIPGITDKSREQIDDILNANRVQTDNMLNVFRQELKLERDQCHEDHIAIMSSISNCQKAITDNQIALVRIVDRIDANKLEK